jgi:ATP-dependent DNA ligase
MYWSLVKASTFQMLIQGGYYGDGKRGGKHSTYLCGLREDGDPPRMKSAPKFLSDLPQVSFIPQGRWRIRRQ